MYELMLVSKLGAGDEMLSIVEKNLKGSGALDVTVDKLGKKPLAYAIKKQTEAEFTVLNFNVEGSAISDLTDILRLEQENLLRYLLIVQKRKKALKKKFVAKKEEASEKEEKPKAKVTVVTTNIKKKVVTKASTPIKLESKVSKGAKVSKTTKDLPAGKAGQRLTTKTEKKVTKVKGKAKKK